MATFAFSAVDVSGIFAKGELEAASKAQVTEQLRQRGLIVLDVSEKREALKLESLTQRFKSVKLRELSVFSRQFADPDRLRHADAAHAVHARGLDRGRDAQEGDRLASKRRRAG